MAKHTFHFRTFATDESDSWNLPPALAGATPFGLYFFLEGEATHICSFEANSRMEFLENVFVDPADPEAADAELDSGELQYENGGEWTSYFGFQDPRFFKGNPYVGRRESFTLDTRDYQIDREAYAAAYARSLRWNSPQKARADAEYDCLREFAYEAAREEFGCNSPHQPPILWGGAVLAEHKRKLALSHARADERSYGPPPLFAAAGITAPLATRPDDLGA